ncbi:MAG: 50S ribosomal protein L24 [Lysobacterales bacterium]|nr:MAG: 50S ribosomal protein L24 [Xanthomonadales bacterium]
MAKIRKGDEIVVRAGKDKGKRGTVLSVTADDRVIVEGINLAKRHVKPNPQRGMGGGIVETEMPLHISNVGVYNALEGKGDRIGYKRLEDGKKVRIYKSTAEVVDV